MSNEISVSPSPIPYKPHHDRCLEKRFHVCGFSCVVKVIKTYTGNSYNKYAQITARAVRNSLKEQHRVAAEKRGTTTVRYQQWSEGTGGPQVRRVAL